MILVLHQLAAVFYLVASLAAGYGVGLAHLRARRFGVATLGAGLLVHSLALAFLHASPDRPHLSDLPPAISITIWLSVLFFLLLRLRMRISGLVVFVAPPAFVGMVFASRWLPHASPAEGSKGLWSHLHILLGSAGLAMLAVAGAAGLLFIFANRVLKDRRARARRIGFPSLEALDRVNRIALSLGLPLLTLGLITGVMWSHAEHQVVWSNSPHTISTAIAWLVYIGLVLARYGVFGQGPQGPLAAAKSAVAGFAILFLAVVGVGLIL